MKQRAEWTAFERAIAAEMQSRPVVWTTDCLEPERLLDLVEGDGNDPAAVPLLAHVAACPYCRREYLRMQETWRLTAPARERSAPAPAALSPGSPSTPEIERPARSAWQQILVPAAGFAAAAVAGLIAAAAQAGTAKPGSTSEEEAVVLDQRLTEAVLEEARRADPPWDPLDYEIFRLRYREGKTPEETARILGRPTATIRSRVHSHIQPVLEAKKWPTRRNEDAR